MMKSKIHRASVTDADLHYEGSITIDSKLMKKSNLLEYEKVQVLNINNGQRINTYTIEGEEGSGTICLNGAAARKFQPGDKVIIISYTDIPEKRAKEHEPTIVHVNTDNSIETVE